MTTKTIPAVVLIAMTGLVKASDWPQWRGPDGQGHARASRLPTFWSETSNVIWKAEIPGRGWSTPVIAGNEIWLTTAIETKATPEDAERRLKANTGDQPVTLLASVELRAVCVDRESGRIKRNMLLLSEREPQWVHELNSYASPTPVLESGRLYAHFGTFGTACLDVKSGAIVWTNTSLRIMHENGPGSSPILWRDLLIFHLDGSDTQSVAALDKRTGRLAWQTARSGEMRENIQLKKSYATPEILSVGGSDVLISQGADWLYGYDPATGSELWKVKYGNLGFSLSAKAVAGHGMLFLSTGFMRPEIHAYRLESPPQLVWKYTKGAPTMPSLLLVGEELYFVSDSGGVLTCLDARTGQEHYRERLGGNHSASPIYADGKLFLPSREGVTAIVRPGRQFALETKNSLPGKILASPTAAGSDLFIRTDSSLYRIGSVKADDVAAGP